MKFHRLPMIVAVLTLALLSASMSHRIWGAQARYSSETRAYGSPFHKIEQQAALENPTDANSVQALIDAVLEFPHSFGQIPPVMREIVEQRLVQAEINYKLGRSAGIPEGNIAKLINRFADKLNLPDYARATPHQVEVLRFGMELQSPSFMGSSSPSEETTPDRDAELSPAQATHILFVLADQKISSPDYQLTPDEWEKTQYQPAMDRLLKYKELKDSGQLKNIVKAGALVSEPLDKDLRTEIYRQVSQMSLTDGLDLVNEAFEMVGIKR